MFFVPVEESGDCEFQEDLLLPTNHFDLSFLEGRFELGGDLLPKKAKIKVCYIILHRTLKIMKYLDTIQ